MREGSVWEHVTTHMLTWCNVCKGVKRYIPETQLSAHHLSISVVPLVVADGAPPSCVKHLHATFEVFLATDQSQRRATAYERM